jgi:hypothetical protein
MKNFQNIGRVSVRYSALALPRELRGINKINYLAGNLGKTYPIDL